MARTHIQFANSSLFNYLSYNSSAIVASHWSKLNFVKIFIDYVKKTQCIYEQSLQRNVIKTKQYISEINYPSNQSVHIFF